MLSKVSGIPMLPEGSQARILRFLWESRSEWSGREIARRLTLSAPACHEALKKLDARGYVLFRRVSNLHLYKINPENYIVSDVFAPFFEAQKAIPAEIARIIKKTLVDGTHGVIVRSLVLFGSRAKGEEDTASDLDLLIVVPTERDLKRVEPELEKLRKLLAQRFNIPFSPYAQTVAGMREKHHKKLPLVERMLKEGQTLYGPSLQELLS